MGEEDGVGTLFITLSTENADETVAFSLKVVPLGKGGGCNLMKPVRVEIPNPAGIVQVAEEPPTYEQTPKPLLVKFEKPLNGAFALSVKLKVTTASSTVSGPLLDTLKSYCANAVLPTVPGP